MTKKEDSPDTELDLEKKIRNETLGSLARLGRSSFLISIINAGLTYYVLKDIAQPRRLMIWLAALLGITIIRSFLVSVFWRMNQDGPYVSLWVTFYVISIYISALCWGVLPLFPSFMTTNWSESFIVFLIAGMSAGGLISLFPLLRAAVPFFIIILFPLIYILGSDAEPSHLVMSVFVGLYLIFLIRSAFILNSVAKKSIRLEIENENLFDFLSEVRSGGYVPVSSTVKQENGKAEIPDPAGVKP